ncbi:hypothetical protein KHA80_15685 [Anaerobacillus sp. HL2]|nr:hypothetical protein KHA80_15685 [Anaerobacillus sp. HL2]
MLPGIRTSGAIEYALVIGNLIEKETKQAINQLNIDDEKKIRFFFISK